MAGPFDPASLQQAVQPVAQQAQQQQAAMPPQQAPPGSMAIPAAGIIGGNAADYLSTLYALNKNPHAREANPLMGNPAAMAAMKGGTGLLELLLAKKLNESGHPTSAKWLGAGIAGYGGALAAHNIGVGNSTRYK